MELSDVKIVLKESLELFLEEDCHLLLVDSSERSITHLIAQKLARHDALIEWDVDCEYSRNGEEIKRLSLPVSKVDSDSLMAKTVYPDIIVHKRGHNGSNLLVIEAKKDSGDSDFDRKKIKAYSHELKYLYGLILTIPTKEPYLFQYEWYEKGILLKIEVL